MVVSAHSSSWKESRADGRRVTKSLIAKKQARNNPTKQSKCIDGKPSAWQINLEQVQVLRGIRDKETAVDTPRVLQRAPCLARGVREGRARFPKIKANFSAPGKKKERVDNSGTPPTLRAKKVPAAVLGSYLPLNEKLAVATRWTLSTHQHVRERTGNNIDTKVDVEALWQCQGRLGGHATCCSSANGRCVRHVT